MPPVEYFALLLQAGRGVIEQHETYQKQTYRNRSIIYTEKGKMILSAPVRKPHGNHTKTKDVLLFNDDKWFIKHWRAIETAYKSTPYFLYYSDEIEMLFKGGFDRLLDFNTYLTRLFCHLLSIDTPLSFSENYMKSDTKSDYRTALSPKKQSVLKNFPVYTQAFSIRHGFIPNLSIIDLLFNLGPESHDYLQKLLQNQANSLEDK